MKLLVQLTHPPLKTSGVTKYFFFFVKRSTKVPLETEQLRKVYLLYHDNFIQPIQKILQSKQQNPSLCFTHGTPSYSISQYDHTHKKRKVSFRFLLPCYDADLEFLFQEVVIDMRNF